MATAAGLVIAAIMVVAGVLLTWGSSFVANEVASAAAGLMLVLSLLGFAHLRRTAPDAEILPRLAAQQVQTA